MLEMGGPNKNLRTGEGIHYVKDNLFPVPPLFATLQQVSGTSWREMYEVFNMGHRMEVIGPEELLPVVEALGREVGIEVRRVGYCEASPNAPKNRVTLHTPGGVEVYDAP